jgi:hypothetical protein
MLVEDPQDISEVRHQELHLVVRDNHFGLSSGDPMLEQIGKKRSDRDSKEEQMLEMSISKEITGL